MNSNKIKFCWKSPTQDNLISFVFGNTYPNSIVSTKYNKKLEQLFVLVFQLSRANLLFVDYPVGTGYSYVDNKNAYCTDLDCMVKDLMMLVKHLMAKQLRKFHKVPFYIFSESYGGKMTAAFSLRLHEVPYVFF